MKTIKNIFFAILFLYFNSSVFSQVAECDLFTIDSITIDTSTNPNTLNVHIFNGDTNISHINYPFVEFVIDDSGDTIASGVLNFFAHLANTSQTYDTQTDLDSFHIGTSYTIILTYLTAFGDTSCIFHYPSVITNTQNDIFKEKIEIYPNPTSSEINILLKNGKKIKTIEFIDIEGQIIRHAIQVSNNKINFDVSGFISGIYFIKVIDETEISYHKKIIIY